MDDRFSPPEAPSTPPSHARYWVIFFASTLSIILYFDRICISQARPLIERDFSLSPEQMGFVFSAFTLAYALFEIPGGWLGDRYGPRRVLTRIVVWWSFFTAATGWARGFLSLVGTRFLFGAGEAGCFPNLVRAYSVWLPAEERPRAQSFLWLSARWSGAFTPFLVQAVLLVVPWRTAFQIFGAVGIVWAVFFYRWYRDQPRDHPSVNEGERAILARNRALAPSHSPLPWKSFLSARTTWLLWLQYFCFSYVWYFFITWLPGLLNKRFGASHGPILLSLLSGLPLLLGGLGSFSSGFVSTALEKGGGSVARSRRIQAAGGFFLAALLIPLSTVMQGPVGVMGVIGLAAFFADFVIPCSWSTCIDVGRRHSGSYSGSMNMMGNLGGALGPVVVGFMQGRWPAAAWNLNLYISSAVLAIGGVCWFFLDPVAPLDRDEAP
jgi:MFS family permease